MARIRMMCAVVALIIGGCSENRSPSDEMRDLAVGSGNAPINEFGFMEAMEQGPQFGASGAEMARGTARNASSNARAGEAEAEAGAQIAYSYSWGFRVSADDLPILQQRHRALCSGLGDSCRVISLSRSGNDEFGYGEMRLQVAANIASGFGDRLTEAIEDVDAEQVTFAISGEDLTDDLIDTEARLEARRALRDRLMEVLRTRQGDVGELVAAERGVANVNEEIDAAASRLANLRNRVAFSDVSITYDPMLGEYRTGFARPIVEAFGAMGTTLGVVIASLIYVTVALVPITIFLLALRWLWRKSGIRIRRAKRNIPA